MTVFFTSDLHLGHANIIKFCDRPFKDTDEMDSIIIRNINSVVGLGDTLYILGDVMMGRNKLERLPEFLRRLTCKDVHLIVGNHDPEDLEALRKCGFSSVDYYKEISDSEEKFVLSHYPFDVWNGKHKNWFDLHGHSHNSPIYNMNNFKEGLRRFDVGVDANGFTPVSAKEIASRFDRENKNSN